MCSVTLDLLTSERGLGLAGDDDDKATQCNDFKRGIVLVMAVSTQFDDQLDFF